MERCDITLRPYVDFDYPRLLDNPLAGEWRIGVENFRVEELPLYPFCGEGEHAALTVEKSGIPTRELATKVAKSLGLSNAAVGYAGMKDKDCVSVQSFTVTGGDEKEAAAVFEEHGARVLAATRHKNKLRLGHLAGNKFTVKLFGGDLEAASAALETLEKMGAPNYYGPQRFGRNGDNAREGFRLLKGGKRGRIGRWKRDLLISSLQSLLFNELLARRLEEGTFSSALAGDYLRKQDSGGIFLCEEVETDNERVAAFEVSPTGPLFGKKMKLAGGAVGEGEEKLLADFGLERELFGRETGTRRELRTPVHGTRAEKTPEGVELHFATPPGVFATSIVREVAASGVKRL